MIGVDDSSFQLDDSLGPLRQPQIMSDQDQGRRGGGPRRDGAGGQESRGEPGNKSARDGGKPRGKGPKKGGKPQHSGPKTYTARPEKKADPDSPFAVLAALKDKK